MTWITLFWGVGFLLAALGVAGTVLPVLPGPPLVLVGLLLVAWADDFSRVGWPTVTLLIFLTLVTLAIDVAAASVGTRRLKASPLAALGAAVGTILGLFFGFIGLLLGPFVGAVAGEYWAQRDLVRAGKVGVAAWIGLILGAVIKLAIVFVMLGWFVLAMYL